jgi:hypothetical protein
MSQQSPVQWLRPHTRALTIFTALLLLVALFSLWPATGQATDSAHKKGANNLLVNGGFEEGFLYYPECGHVGKGWQCFTNNGQIEYGFYDDQWAPVVDKGSHSQLIELDTKNWGVSDPDRYAGIYQTVRVEPGAAYQFAMRGMIRTTDNNSNHRDPYRYRVQFGWTFGPNPDWTAVQKWVDVGWNRYDDRLQPGRFNNFSAKILAQEELMTIYVRVWKKWGDVNEELNVNLDNLSLVGSSVDALVFPTLEPTALPPDAPPPLRLNGGTPVAELPTPSSVYGRRYVPVPGAPPGTENWPHYYGDHIAFAYPRTWQPRRLELAGDAVFEIYRLGIPDQLQEQIMGFSNVPFGDLQRPDVILASRITIGGKEGVKWLRQGPNYIIHEYCTSGINNEGSFCLRVLLPTDSPMIELQLDRLIQTIVFY